MTRLVVVGDSLLDLDVNGSVERLAPDGPAPVVDTAETVARPGGAALAAALAARDGHEVLLVTALADDGNGSTLARLIRDAGVDLLDVALDGETPTKTRIRADGRLLVRVDDGAPGNPAPFTAAARAAVERAPAVLVSDYGRGLTRDPALQDAVSAAAERACVVWDPHPRGARPPRGLGVATPNRAEVRAFRAGANGRDLRGLTDSARALRDDWACDALAVTLGADGALVVAGDAPPLRFLAPRAGGYQCGAGDRFASALLGGLAEGRSLPDAVELAVESATTFVADGGAAAFRANGAAGPLAVPDAAAALASVRARGGTVVATGGCFDLLHAGHVATLEAARSLGDCLVVCLNSDESVRRLKGPDRPLVCEDDRAAVLRGLAAVDAVVVFDEDTPAQAIERLRPDVWAKGGDYTLEALPEAELVASWGGQAVVLPYVEGFSTTRLLEEAMIRGGS
jgi:rfaE bifunctional protein nucleotidyltransferase chain/domain/rfaE bifunctional protein kinase chain/domain